MSPVIQQVARAVAVFVCVVVALLDLVTVWTTLTWLHWTAHLPLVLFWFVRGALLLVSARWLVQQDRRGAWTAMLLLGSMPLIYLLPFVDHAENQYHRRSVAALGALASAVLIGLSRRHLTD